MIGDCLELVWVFFGKGFFGYFMFDVIYVFEVFNFVLLLFFFMRLFLGFVVWVFWDGFCFVVKKCWILLLVLLICCCFVVGCCCVFVLSVFLDEDVWVDFDDFSVCVLLFLMRNELMFILLEIFFLKLVMFRFRLEYG